MSSLELDFWACLIKWKYAAGVSLLLDRVLVVPHIEAQDAAQRQEESESQDGSGDESKIDPVETSYA